MEFSVLGPLEVHTAAEAVPIRRGLPTTLLIALLLRPGQTVSSDFLIDILWGDEPPRNPANAVQVQVSYLRKVLGSADPNGSSLLQTRPGGYSLVVEPTQVDAGRFEAALRNCVPVETLAAAGALADALDHIETALALWRGEPLEDVAGQQFALGEVTRLEELRWAASERRVDLLLRLGRHQDAIAILADLVRRLPLRERLHEFLVLALYRGGRQADALRAYEEARRVLVDELGIDPGPELRELERRILQQDPTLDWTRPEPEPAAHRSAEDAEGAVTDTGRRVSGRLPTPVSALIGRDDELRRLRDFLAEHRAITLTGPAGAGKTRLAIELASRDNRPVCYVDFSPIEDPSLVASTVAAAIGVTVSPGDDVTASVADTLAARQLVLVLDTCEHVVGAAARFASALLQAAPKVQILATSRRALGVSGEFAWPVPPLALPPADATAASDITAHAATALFIERASSVRPDLDIDDAAAADIAAVCLALDGLPLAIELAAARADVLSPRSIRALLEDRFALLVDGDADAVQRQQTLRGAVDWSFELLTADQRTFFARLGVFAGTFELDAALVVGGAGFVNPLELLASLVKQSMVTRAGDDRYRLLDTLRAYALDVLADLDADDTRERHADFYVDLAERGELQIRGPDQLAWLGHLRSDVDNFRASLEWCLLTGDTTRAAREAGALAWFWTLNGMLSEAIHHLERLVDAEEIAPGTRGLCMSGYALLAASFGQLEQARDFAYRGAELGRLGGDDRVIGRALNAAAVTEWALGDHERSLDAHREAIGLFGKSDDPWGLAICHVLQARTLFDLGDSGAAAVALEGVDHARRAGDLHVLGIALTQIAQIALAEGDAESAVAAATEALEVQERIGYTEGTVSALHVLGHAHRVARDISKAREHHRRALGLAVAIGHAAATCEALEDLAQDEAGDQPELASSLLAAARTERARRGLPVRQRDAAVLDALEEKLGARPSMSRRSFAELIAEMTS